MRVVFIGVVQFSLSALEKLISLNANVITVLSRKDPGNHADYADIGAVCRKHGIEYKPINDINSVEVQRYLKKKSPDYLFCFGWSQLLGKKLLQIPKCGTIGFHPALVPQNRGRHPIIWALVLGLKKTGSTFFFIDEGVDTGDILSQREVEITYEDDAQSLYQKITVTALEQIEEFLPQLKVGTYQRLKQQSVSTNVWRKRTKKDGEIDWRMSSYSIYNLVRALTRPYPGAHFVFKNQEIKVWKVREVRMGDIENIEYGKVLKVFPDRTFVVKAGEQAVYVLEYDSDSVFIKEAEYLQ